MQTPLQTPLDKDVVAWTRLLADPNDASAVVRALARPPIELRQVDLARVIQIARRRKLDMLAALRAAIESPQLPPEARTRIARFLELHTAAAQALDAARPDLLARAALGAEREPPQGASTQSPHAADEALRDIQRIVSEEVLADVLRIGAHLNELRLDTDLDVSHGVARYLELLKLSALAQRSPEQSLADALADVNARLLVAATALQREILQSSPLDTTILSLDEEAGEGETKARAHTSTSRGEPSLHPFLPRKGVGLALSASDIETYRGCPLRYKFARVLRIPTETTVGQRFGIVVHQVLERYHSAGGRTLEQLLDLLDASWRRAGFTGSRDERELRAKARLALERYHARLHTQEAEPIWFERQFSLQIGPHHLRGRVDRVDRLPAFASAPATARVPPHEGAHQVASPAGAVPQAPAAAAPTGGEAYELIDYKTSKPKPREELVDDVQLSLYALAARESWGLQAVSGAYYYVLDDLKVTLPREADPERVRETVMEVGEGILGQRFEPTPSKAACSLCDFRIVCPAAER